MPGEPGPDLHTSPRGGTRAESPSKEPLSGDEEQKSRRTALQQLERSAAVDHARPAASSIQKPEVASPRQGNEALRMAARKGRRGSVVRLLQANADPNALGGSGSTALHMACVTGDHEEVVQVLLAMNANVQAETQDNQMRALAVASYYGRPRCVEALLAAGADVNVADSSGWTCRDWAEHMDQKQVLALLPAEALCRRPTSRLDDLSPRWDTLSGATRTDLDDTERAQAAARIQSRLRGNHTRHELEEQTRQQQHSAAPPAAQGAVPPLRLPLTGRKKAKAEAETAAAAAAEQAARVR